ncbi:hypothetical protein BRADI_1g01387v3, partial [Brachypodium distachyon]
MAHVVSASLGALGPLLLKLTGLLTSEYGRLKGVRSEIMSLRCELSSMHAAANKYTMLEDPDVQVKAWMSIVRELAYDIEDCIDKFIHRLGNGVCHSGFKEFLRKTAQQLNTLGDRYGIADEIDELKARIKQVKELKNSYKLDDTPCSTSSHTTVDPRLHALFAEDAHLVGVDGPRDFLSKWMLEEGNGTTKHHRRVLSIVGFGGLGKTTLANKVYQNIQGHYDCRAFVTLSQKPDKQKIIKDVISQVSCRDGYTKNTDDWDERKSMAQLRGMLQDKRYIVVIDDIWSAAEWDAIKYAFPENSCSSRIIVTTRIVDVARSCCLDGDNFMYEMKALSDVHSRRLFFKRIFGSEDCCPDVLKEVSNEILKKCGGMPLAIISTSGLLANKPAIKEEWEKVKRSIGFALEKNQSLERVSIILSLSYDDLPPNLKTCLLYLSAFPEDCVIERERLVWRWIAEGFISEERGQSQQEVAENYFYELINKSMLQPVDIGCDGKARACRVHDMMLEIIISKSSEDNFFTVVGIGQTSLANRHGTIRRLSVQHIDHELASALSCVDLSHVRSLTVKTSDCIKHLPCLLKFKALRVVDFADCEGLEEYIINGMEKLFQLKYLRLRGRSLSKLPSRIVLPDGLETLDLRDTSVNELPVGIIKLMKLRHVLVAGETKIPNGIGGMRNLRVISGFNITRSPADAVEDLGNLASLDELNVCLNHVESDEYKRHEVMLLSSLSKLVNCKLRSLEIISANGSLEFLSSWSHPPSALQIFSMSSDYYFPVVPKWIGRTLTSLVSLEINLTDLTEEGLCILGELPALLRLKLSLKTGPKDKVTVKGIGFPSLKEFSIFCTDGEGAYVTFVKGAMPKLEILKLPFTVSVAKKHGFSLGIEHLPCLKHAAAWLNKGATRSESQAEATAFMKE